jgi:hypothetical protein
MLVISSSQPLCLAQGGNEMRSHRLYVFAVVVSLSVSAVLITKASRSKIIPQGPPATVAVLNKTSAFQVVKAERVHDKFTLSLKNNYGHRITAFVITIGKNFRITEDFIGSEVSDEVGIKSQETYERTYPIPSTQQFEPSLDVTLQAVVLDNKTGDGDPIVFEEIRDTRLGQAIQIRRSLRLLDKYMYGPARYNNSKLKNDLEKALNAPDTETLTELRELHPLGLIDPKGQSSVNDFFRQGLAAGRNDVLKKLNEVEQSATGTETLLKMKAHFQKLLDRF